MQTTNNNNKSGPNNCGKQQKQPEQGYIRSPPSPLSSTRSRCIRSAQTDVILHHLFSPTTLYYRDGASVYRPICKNVKYCPCKRYSCWFMPLFVKNMKSCTVRMVFLLWDMMCNADYAFPELTVFFSNLGPWICRQPLAFWIFSFNGKSVINRLLGSGWSNLDNFNGRPQ